MSRQKAFLQLGACYGLCSATRQREARITTVSISLKSCFMTSQGDQARGRPLRTPLTVSTSFQRVPGPSFSSAHTPSLSLSTSTNDIMTVLPCYNRVRASAKIAIYYSCLGVWKSAGAWLSHSSSAKREGLNHHLSVHILEDTTVKFNANPISSSTQKDMRLRGRAGQEQGDL